MTNTTQKKYKNYLDNNLDLKEHDSKKIIECIKCCFDFVKKTGATKPQS